MIAQGEAGGLSYAVLDAGAGQPLLDWLDAEGYRVPAEALPAIEWYTGSTEVDWRFVAIRVTDAERVTALDVRTIPPVELTVRADRPRYPMVISSVSAAPISEVVIYTLAATAQVPVEQGVFTIAESELVPDANPSGTNYEDLVSAGIAARGPGALVLEHVGGWSPSDSVWPDAPWGPSEQLVLTRMRTLLAPDEMTFDYLFEAAPAIGEVSSDFWVGFSETQSRIAAVTWALIPFGFLLTRRAMVRRRIRRPGTPCRSTSGSP